MTVETLTWWMCSNSKIKKKPGRHHPSSFWCCTRQLWKFLWYQSTASRDVFRVGTGAREQETYFLRMQGLLFPDNFGGPNGQLVYTIFKQPWDCVYTKAKSSDRGGGSSHGGWTLSILKNNRKPHKNVILGRHNMKSLHFEFD